MAEFDSRDLASLRIGFVGAGRLGHAMAWSLARRGLTVTSVTSRNATRAASLAGTLAGCRADDLQSLIDRCDLVFVTTPDAAIEPTARRGRWRCGMAVVHCSGVTEVEALSAAAEAGAEIGGFHPMQTFGDAEVAMQSLPGCTVTIEASEPLNAVLVAIAQHLNCRVNRLPPGMRARYHAAAGYTSQFVNVLFAEAVRLWESWGATEAQAVAAMLPLVRGTLAAIDSVGVAEAMPGPVSRGDVASIDKHLAAIVPFGDEMLERYCSLCRATVALATARGAIDDQCAERFLALLDEARVGTPPGPRRTPDAEHAGAAFSTSLNPRATLVADAPAAATGTN